MVWGGTKGRAIVVGCSLAVATSTVAAPAAAERAAGGDARGAPTSLTIRSSDATIRVGRTVRLVAALDGPGGGQRIRFDRLVGGRAARIGSCATGPAGRCSITVAPRRSSTYRAVFTGSGSWDASTSAAALVQVRVAAGGRLSGSYARAGRWRLYRMDQRVIYDVAVQPRRRGWVVRFPLEFNYGRGWRDGGTSTFRTDARGRIHIFFEEGVLPPGAYRIRARVVAARGLLGGASPLAYFRVND